MARRVDRPTAPTAAPEGAAALGADDDTRILHPERAVTIQGRQITVREFTLADTLRLHAVIARVVQAFMAMPDAGKIEPSFADLVAVLGADWADGVQMIATSCDQPADWVGALRGIDGELLLQTFWVVNAPFFINRLLTEVEYQRAAAAPQGSARSTPRSSPPDTGGVTSPDTPPGS